MHDTPPTLLFLLSLPFQLFQPLNVGVTKAQPLVLSFYILYLNDHINSGFSDHLCLKWIINLKLQLLTYTVAYIHNSCPDQCLTASQEELNA